MGTHVRVLRLSSTRVTLIDSLAVTTEDEPEIIECELRLHRARPAGAAPDPGQLTWADWAQTVVGEPVTFRAVAITGKGAWNGPLPPGAQVAAPVTLDDPWWTIFLPSGRGVPVMVGQVGRPLSIGDSFALPPRREGEWTDGIAFQGAIVIE
jgi:hypothetical protein